MTGLKKNLVFPTEVKKGWIERDHPDISIERQCEICGLVRSGYYYSPKGESQYNQSLMDLIDEEFTLHPFQGYRKMTKFLRKKGHRINSKRIRRLMGLMGLEAVFPGKKTSIPNKEHKKYPYLLGDIEILKPNQVWSMDITYIRIKGGFIYLTAVLDWFSRYVLSWEVSNTLDSGFCLGALKDAMKFGKPEIMNTDQGVQYTSTNFTGFLEANNIRISMDGKGRAFDNIFVERLWRSLKYEEVYLKNYETVQEAVTGIKEYFRFYNKERLHQSLGYETPESVYFGFIFDRNERNV